MFEFILLLQLHEAKSYSSIRCLLDWCNRRTPVVIQCFFKKQRGKKLHKFCTK